jgi:hypothetical protein
MNGEPLPNIWTETDELEFELQFSGYPETESLFVHNTGTDTLLIANIQIEGEAFSYAGPTEFEILPNEMTVLEIMMDATVTGYYLGDLTIFSNDPDNPEHIISLYGTCVQPPVIAVNPLEITMELADNITTEAIVQVENNGGYDLIYALTIEEVNGAVTWLELDHDFNIINPSSNDEVTLFIDTTGLEEGTYIANLLFMHNDPSQEDIIVEITLNVVPVSADEDITLLIPILGDNYPNPFNPQTTISFSITDDIATTSLVVYNSKGQKIKTLINEVLHIGSHKIVWNGLDESGNNVASGIYLYKMRSGNYSAVKKMIMLK